VKARFALFVLFALCSSFLTAQTAAPAPQGEKQLTIEEMFKPGGILGRGPENVQWSPDGVKVSFVQRDDSGDHGELYYVDVATGKSAVLVASGKLASLAPPASAIKDERKKEAAQRYSIAAYQWAPDSKHLLFDSMGQLWLYSLDNGTAVQLTSSNDESADPKFSPDGDRISYVRKHNLYVRTTTGNEERQLTKDGNDNLLNGEVDWVYEEELYSRSNYFWSPNGKQFVFLQMDEKDVPTYPITDWIPTHPTVDQEKYPQPGDPNPGVRLAVVGSNGGKIKWITASSAGALPLNNDPNVLIPRFGWVRNGLLWAMALNRIQDRLDLYFIDVDSGKSQLMMTESTDAWIDMHPEVDFKLLDSGDGYLWTSWRDGHNHIYLYRFDKQNPLSGPAKMEAQLTHGDWEVESVDGVDQQGIVYFSANEGDWRQRNEFAVGLNGQNFHRISKQDGSHFADFDPKNAKYYVDNFSALTIPPSTSVCSVDGACTAFWQPHSVEAYNLLTPKVVDFKAADGTTTLEGEILLPPPGGPMISNGKVPLIVNPYGGPGAQTIRDFWIGYDLFDQILARQGFAVLHVDNRGMANRGKAFALPVKHHLGPVELSDQLAAVKQALEQFPQLDSSRIGFWGWSYGGTFTLYAMEHSDVFKSGVSVAPVSNWLLYDSIYTERYMGLPKDNEAGYKDSSPVNFAADLHGKLLEVHGTSDDNVHVQNTIQMVNNLINASKQFRLMVYPGKTHGIAGFAARTHLFHMIDDYFLETLAPGK